MTDPQAGDQPNPSDSSDDLDDEDSAALELQHEIAESIREKLPQGSVENADELAQLLARVVSVEIQEFTRTFYQGPIPSPEMLREYEEVCPGLAQKIFDHAQKEQSFRHDAARFRLETDRKAAFHSAVKTYVGQGLGFALSFTAIFGGIWLLAHDRGPEGLASIITAIAALVTVFIVGRRTGERSATSSDDDEPAKGA